MFENFENEILIIARLLLGGAFVFAGLRNIQNRKLVASLMAARGVPQAALALWLGIVLQVAAGALVIAGLWTAPAAAALILFLIVATPMFHNFSGCRSRCPYQRCRQQCRTWRRLLGADRAFALTVQG